jgi:hypothetical protein
MANYAALGYDLLHELFVYDGENLRWRYSRGSRAQQGSIAGSKTNFGYVSVRINKKPYQAHKIIYFMLTGEWPEFIDHINGNRADNRIENLRPATKRQNIWNQDITSRNTSGIKGISFDKSVNRWYARVSANGIVKRKTFKDISDAEAWVVETRNNLHGEFACHGRVAS